jgi:DNA-binding MarR family transcriptional regulator
MSSKLQHEIQQSQPFRSIKEEAWLNLARSAAVLQHELEQALRPYGLSPTQYNVLRILRGARSRPSAEPSSDGKPEPPEAGLGQREIAERLVAQVPDVPRILERMERAGWITRTRGKADRRTTFAAISASGLGLLERLDCLVESWMKEKFAEVPCAELERFNELLTLARR